MSEPIWANHAHVFPAEVRAQGSIETLLRLMDDCGIERAVCFAPFTTQLTGTGIEGNEWLAGELAHRADRLLGFGTLDLSSVAAGADADPEQMVAQVTRIRERGFLGIKLHPAVQQFHILSAPLLAAYARAEELGLFLSFHTGVHHARISDARLVDFDEVAYRFPRLRFSLEHVGGYAFYREAVGVIQNNLGRPHATGKGNVYAGLTSVFSLKEPAWYLPASGPDSLEGLVVQIGADHALFGLDFPYKSTKYIQEAIATVQRLAITEADKALILGGTLRSLIASPDGERGQR